MGLRILLAGASGAIGRRLTPLLLNAGHSVVGTTRADEGVRVLRALGAEAVIVDALDADGLAHVVSKARPDIVINQLTALGGADPARLAEASVRNAHLRGVGGPNLVNAALAAGARRLICQSITWAYAPGSTPRLESDPLDIAAEGGRAITVQAVIALERAVLGSSPLEGIVLRYGQLYGPGAANAAPEGKSPLHIDAASYAALLAIDHGGPGIFNIAEPNDQVATDKARAELGWRADFRLPA